jgi:hypothetical protein
MEQWEVRAEDYANCFDNLKSAKRDFGLLKKDIKEDEEGWVELYYRADDKSPWVMQQRFYLGIELPKEVKKK